MLIPFPLFFYADMCLAFGQLEDRLICGTICAYPSKAIPTSTGYLESLATDALNDYDGLLCRILVRVLSGNWQKHLCLDGSDSGLSRVTAMRWFLFFGMS